MPAVKTGVLPPDEMLVRIANMEDWAQLAFDGYKCACSARMSSLPLFPRSLQRSRILQASLGYKVRERGAPLYCLCSHCREHP